MVFHCPVLVERYHRKESEFIALDIGANDRTF